MKKFNWGTGIFIYILLFFFAAIVFIIWTLGLDFNLVEKDYYPKGLQYEVMKKKIINTDGLVEKLTASITSENIRIHFPDLIKGKSLSGNLWIYRPSDEKMDVKYPLVVDSALCMFVPKSKLSKGKYILKFDWKLDSIPYYHEIEVYNP